MSYQPQGIQFYDQASRREMILINQGPHTGWLVYKHPDGQWVTLRRASDEDLASLHQHRDEDGQSGGEDSAVDA